MVEGRVDSTAQQMGAKRMENFIPMPTGGMRKRPGTVYDDEYNGIYFDEIKQRIITKEGESYLLIITHKENDNEEIEQEIEQEIRIYKMKNNRYILVYHREPNSIPLNILTNAEYIYNKNEIWQLGVINEDIGGRIITWDGDDVTVENTPQFIGHYWLPKSMCLYAGIKFGILQL